MGGYKHENRTGKMTIGNFNIYKVIPFLLGPSLYMYTFLFQLGKFTGLKAAVILGGDR
jgi:hypothetical protein